MFENMVALYRGFTTAFFYALCYGKSGRKLKKIMYP
jgi:hypothetical protein